jgi:hypothetical protein
VPTVNVTGKPLVSEDRARWIKLIRWLTREVAGWRDHADPRRDKLVAIFVVTHSCDFENILWGKLPDHVGANTELNNALERMLSSSTVEFTFRQSSSVPVWEREAVETFRRADEKGDWVGIASECRRFENAFLPNVLLVQIVRYLYQYAFSQLVRALSRVRQTPLAMQIAAALSAEQRLYLANEGGQSVCPVRLHISNALRSSQAAPIGPQGAATLNRATCQGRERRSKMDCVDGSFQPPSTALSGTTGGVGPSTGRGKRRGGQRLYQFDIPECGYNQAGGKPRLRS